MSTPNTSLSPPEAVRILRRWGFEADERQIEPGSGTANAGAIVSLPDRRLMLRRRNSRYARTDWVRFDHALLAHLAADGLPVPRGVSGTIGQSWLHESDQVYELFAFIEGGQHTPGDPNELRAAGEVLAGLHLSARRLDPPVEKHWPRFHDPGDLPEWLEPLVEQAHGTDAAVLADARALALELAARLDDDAYRSLPRTIVQGDYHPANLKFRAGRVVGVFDWDWASSQPRMVDVADGLLFFCGVRNSPLVAGDIWSLTEAFRIDQARVERFLDGYLSRLTPSAGELRALPDLMRCRWLYCRVDAARRKVEPERRVEFLTRDLELPLRSISDIEAKLTD